MVIQRPEFKGLVLCRELWLFALPGLDEELDAVEGNKGWPLRDEFVDKLLDRVSPANKKSKIINLCPPELLLAEETSTPNIQPQLLMIHPAFNLDIRSIHFRTSL